ncbi:MAG: S8 family serine peptidase, partial [Actinobacteria bacterium]|nr:S8 family serine peptidase [Actinomycetota bacterium]MCG2808543.1 S8 family serine peptidase [Coriobacteriia bacterium]
MSVDMGEGWHVGRKDGGSEWKGGPYTWPQLIDFAAEGRLTADDLVWHPSMSEWLPARDIPGLFAQVEPAPAPQPAPAPEPVAAPEPTPVAAPAPAPAPVAEPAPEPAPTPAQTASVPPAPPREPGRGWLIAIAAIAGVVLLAGIGTGAWYLFGRGDGGGGPKLGVAEVKLPDATTLVQTEWGEVPAGQIVVMVTDDGRRKDAEKLAAELNGSVVGELEFGGLYQIEFPGKTEADLVAALDTASANEKMALAFPNQQSYLDAEIWGVRVDPYDDPIYGEGAGDGYKAIGVGQAWTYIKGAGIELTEVKVGVTDSGIYKPGDGAENEFDGNNVKLEFTDGEEGELNGPNTYDDGSVNEAGSHGTGVSTIIGGDPDNGGPSGVAGPLGNKMKISVTNIFSNRYGDTTSTPDPDDPTKYTHTDGKTYAFGDLIALKKQVEGKAKVINCSWGNAEAHPATAAAYKKFFEKMAEEHPDVLFVCSGGNTGAQIDGSKRYPSGLALPNMITVGAVDNDGKLAEYSSKASPNYEVTLAAPGTQAVVGMKDAGGSVRQDGTSFAAPHVTAAAAMLKALNPELQAGDIKRILTETARTAITTGDKTVNAPAETGGKILAIDQAVLKVINDLRKAKGMPEFTKESLEQRGVIDAVAITGSPGEYTVKGIVKAAGDKGADITIDVWAENSAVGGKTTQSVGASGGEVSWGVTLPEDKGTIRVKRSDNGAASLITIEKININGAWSGNFTITDITIIDQEAAEDEGCVLPLLKALEGQVFPMNMDVSVDEGGQGSAVVVIDASSMNEEGESGNNEPQTWDVSYTGTTIIFTPQDPGGISSLSSVVSRSGNNLVQKGAMS